MFKTLLGITNLDIKESYPDKRIVCTIVNEIGVELFYTTDFYSEKDNRQTGSFMSRFVIPKRVLNKGVYTIRVRIDIPKLRVLVESNDYISFCIEETTFNQMGVFAHNEPKGLFHLDINWKTDNR